MSWGPELYSPNRHFLLTTLEGNPEDIASAGREYSRIGEQMEWTAAELDSLAGNTKYKAEGLDAIREAAGELAGDLHNVAKRYINSGPVLTAYASALSTAQSSGVDPHVEPIREAHAAHKAALVDLADAENLSDDLESTTIFESEPTDAERQRAASDLSDARTAERSLESNLDELWVTFESGYDAWENAYETAVSDMETALETSGINDTWWEDTLDVIATVATVVGTILVVAALIITGPISGILLAVAAALSAIALIAHVIMLSNGSRRTSWTDVVFDAIGVVPFLGAFVKGIKPLGMLGSLRSAAGLSGATRTTLTAGRNAIAYDLRSISGAGGIFGGQGPRLVRAQGLADEVLATVRGSNIRTTWNAILTGGTRLDGQALTMSQRIASAWPGGRAGGATANWARGIDGAGPMGVVNVWNFGFGGYQTAQAAGVPLPDMPDFIPNPFEFIPDMIQGR